VKEILELVPSNSRRNTFKRFFKSLEEEIERKHVSTPKNAILNKVPQMGEILLADILMQYSIQS